MLENPERRKLLKEVQSSSEGYLKAFQEVIADVDERSNLVDNTLDRLGPVMASEIESMVMSFKKEQDVLGPLVQSKVFKASATGLTVSVIVLVFSIVTAVFLTRMITGPVAKVGAYVKQLADGDFTATIDFNSEDEIGHMVKALTAMGKLYGMVSERSRKVWPIWHLRRPNSQQFPRSWNQMRIVRTKFRIRLLLQVRRPVTTCPMLLHR